MEKINSREVFARLVNQYQNLIFSICLKLTGDYFASEDLAQETFLAAYTHWEEFDGQSEKAWLCRIASNKCIDYRRAAARREQTVEGELLEGISDGKDPLECCLNLAVLEKLRICCNALPPPYREVARAHFLEGKTAREIAEQSGTGLNTVKTQIRRGREMLKKSFGKEVLER